MDETEFWENLKYRMNCRTAGSTQVLILPGWCDWFTPIEYLPNDETPRISGRVGFLAIHSKLEMDFVLYLPKSYSDRNAIDWPTLIPPEGLPGWLMFDAYQNRLELRPPA